MKKQKIIGREQKPLVVVRIGRFYFEIGWVVKDIFTPKEFVDAIKPDLELKPNKEEEK